VGLLGGSFNPPHAGHLEVARAVRAALGLDEVWLVPAARPPHKPDHPEMAPAEDRLAMSRLAAEGDGLGVCDVELARSGPSYTIDTVRELKAAHPGTRFAWLIGADSVDELPTWRRAGELLREVDVVVVTRPGHDLEQNLAVVARALGPEAAAALRRFVVEVEAPDSSTEIRRRIRAGEPWEDRVPPRVAEFIRARGLYRRSA
jgi:nicotinate-nucleotide adenylyltransferase